MGSKGALPRVSFTVSYRMIFAEALSIQNAKVKNSYFSASPILRLLKTIVKFLVAGAMHPVIERQDGHS